jgi:hypothetical protein
MEEPPNCYCFGMIMRTLPPDDPVLTVATPLHRSIFRKHRQCLVLSLPLPAAAVSLEVPNGTSYRQVVHVRKGHKLYFTLQPSAHEIQSCLFDLFKFIVNILKRIDLPLLSADIALSSKRKLQKKTKYYAIRVLGLY